MMEIALLSSRCGVLLSGRMLVKRNEALRIVLISSILLSEEAYLSIALPTGRTYCYIKENSVEIPFECLSNGTMKMAVVSENGNKIWNCEKIEVIEIKNGDFMLFGCDEESSSQLARIKVALDELTLTVDRHDKLVKGFDERLDEIMGNYDLL